MVSPAQVCAMRGPGCTCRLLRTERNLLRRHELRIVSRRNEKEVCPETVLVARHSITESETYGVTCRCYAMPYFLNHCSRRCQPSSALSLR
jgi:hypothetical protein